MAIRNALTVDVEDYFHVSAFANSVNQKDWDNYPLRVEENTHRLMGMFDEAQVKATFFVLGWVAEKKRSLINEISARGHEVACHGYSHQLIYNQTREVFREETIRSKSLLEDIVQAPVRGYRAASYSIVRETLWAHDLLQEAGYRYSSSVYPIHHDLYGIPDAPRFAYRVGKGGLLEIPVTTVSLFNHNLPCGGGGYFRLLPYRLSRWAMRRVNSRDRMPCVFYFHPWEIDPDQPRQAGISAKARFRHYLNLGRMKARIEGLLRDFRWDRMDRVFLTGDETQ